MMHLIGSVQWEEEGQIEKRSVWHRWLTVAQDKNKQTLSHTHTHTQKSEQRSFLHLPLSMISDNKWRHYFFSPRLVPVSHLMFVYCWGRRHCHLPPVSATPPAPPLVGVRPHLQVGGWRTALWLMHLQRHSQVLPPICMCECCCVCECAWVWKKISYLHLCKSVCVCVIMCVTVSLQPPTVGQVLLMVTMTYNNVTSVLYMAKSHVLVRLCVVWTWAGCPFFFFSKTPCFTLTGTLCGCLLWSNGRCLSLGVCAWLMTQCWWRHTEWGAHRVILKWHSGGTWACICVFAVCTAPLDTEVTRARLGLVVLTQTQSPGGSLTGNNSVWTDPSAHTPTFHWINVGFCLVSGVHFSLGKRPVDLSCPHHSMALSLLQVNK